MHSEDGEEDMGHISEVYGVWPTAMGALFGAGVIWLMFALSDGFT